MIQPQAIYRPLYLDKDKFIIIVTGGRGSGKSFNVSTFIERLMFEMTPAKKIAHQILYTRYTMMSANISVIPEFLEKVELDGTSKYFKTTKTDVVNTMTGSSVMFRGIKTSSGNQTAKLKSIHGITTFVVDEAEEWTSEKDFEKIMLSIRRKGIQNRIVIIMNPTDNNHWVYKRFIEKTHKIVYYDGVPVQISTHPNVLHIHTTYLDNIENLSPEFLKEIQDMKENDPDKYAHTVMGKWADVAEGAIFPTIYECDVIPEYCNKPALAQDYGFTCFRGDTLITTQRGEVPIKDVKVGDYVLTRNGYHRVRKNIYNGVKKVIEKELVTDLHKSTFFATFEHNFNANGKWKKYGELTKRDTLCVLSNSMGTHTKDTQMGNIRTTTTNRMVREGMIRKCCTMQFGSFIIRKLFQRICAYIMSTITHLITILVTLCSLLAASIKGYTLKNWKRFWRKEKISLGRTRKKIGKSEEKRLSAVCNRIQKSVNGAVKSLLRLMYTKDFVPRNATTDGNTNLLQTMWRWSANIVEKRLWEINISSPNAVQTNTHINYCGLTDVRTKGEQWCDVYDLEIEDVHEYFANGFLVHNCDPSAIIRCAVYDKDLYFDEVCYRTGMLTSEIIKEDKKYDLDVVSESADPRMIREISNSGVRIYSVDKGPGSINSGIDFMQGYRIHVTKRSTNLLKEFRNYVWDKDNNGNYINKPIDAWNHCFTADTLVKTINGEKNINNIQIGDMVLTSNGYKTVTKIFKNGYRKVLHIRIKFRTFVVEITGTPDHKIKTKKGWKELQKLTKGDVLYLCKSSMAKPITNMQVNDISQGGHTKCTVMYGNTIMEQSRKGIIYTILTKIHHTMIYPILNCLKNMSTLGCTKQKNSKTTNIENSKSKEWTMRENMLINGMARKQGTSGMLNMGKMLWLTLTPRHSFASIAEKNMRRSQQGNIISVLTNAKRLSAIIRELITNCVSAKSVEKNLLPTNIQAPNIAAENVLEEPLQEQDIVEIEIVSEYVDETFDIEVEYMHEFFANGILVHNCIDACRYYCLGKLLGKMKIDQDNSKYF